MAPTSHVRKINSRPGIKIYAPLHLQVDVDADFILGDIVLN